MTEVKTKPQLDARWIDPAAKDIVQRLQRAGYTTYLVGGCVRDLLAGLHPKDYDIATNAEPEKIRRLIHGSYVIGRRFRLVLVKRGNQQFEVSTFRRESQPEDFSETTEESPILGDNFFGTPEQDALRRDFTVNALFYDPVTNEVIDYCQGRQDLEKHLLKMIGDPAVRLKEDPIRSLRAIRLSHKLGLQIEEELRRQIQMTSEELNKSVLPRRREEFLKFLRLPDPIPAWLEIHDLGLLSSVAPRLSSLLDTPHERDLVTETFERMRPLSKMTTPVETLFPFLFGLWKVWQEEHRSEEDWNTMLKEELGVFKAEQNIIQTAIEMHDKLPKAGSFMKRSSKRQQNFIRNDWLPLALMAARSEYTINAEDYAFWMSSLAAL